MSNSLPLPFSLRGELPQVESPTLVVMLTGWIDASGAALGAIDHFLSATDATTFLEFDPDTFIDYRARRPVMELREGVNTRIVWTVPEMKIGKDAAGKEILFLVGPEPDTAWKHFADTVAALAIQLGVEKMIGMGAYPYGAPHTRPVGISATTPIGRHRRTLVICAQHTRRTGWSLGHIGALAHRERHRRDDPVGTDSSLCRNHGLPRRKRSLGRGGLS